MSCGWLVFIAQCIMRCERVVLEPTHENPDLNLGPWEFVSKGATLNGHPVYEDPAHPRHAIAWAGPPPGERAAGSTVGAWVVLDRLASQDGGGRVPRGARHGARRGLPD